MKQIREVDVAARFWICPKCRRHVPSRTAACWCGFDRSRSAYHVTEVSLGAPVEPGDGQERLWSVIGIALAVVTTWLVVLWL